MRQKWWIFFLMVFVVSLLIASVTIRPKKTVDLNKDVPGLTTIENNAIAERWAREFIQKYPPIPLG